MCAVDKCANRKHKLIKSFVQPKKKKKKTPCVRVIFNGYTEKRLLGTNNDVLRGGGDGVNHSKKLYSQGLYHTFETATET